MKNLLIFFFLAVMIVTGGVLFWQNLSTEPESKLPSNKSLNEEMKKVELASVDDLSYPSKIEDNRMHVYKDEKWVPITIKGVNIGMGKPGHFPGEAAIDEDEYLRWFQQIGDMNANAIRIYTLHPPGFYKALAAYNAQAEQPLYVLHGVWVDETPLEETEDAFHKEITDSFQNEMKKIADAIHGQAEVKPSPGHASGVYDIDVSPYVIGWIIGIEWHPKMVDSMDRAYPDLGDFDGEYVFTEGASPMEHWLAVQLETLTAYESENYKSMRPISFTNWVTTDHIDQPAEPLEEEDLASIDPNHFHRKGAGTKPGMFASYHVYPYYPDFMNLEEKYTKYLDHRGERNNYAGYLHDLSEANDMPVLIAEFGVPASRGLTHRNPFGWNQGFHSEKEQGQIVKRLYEDILEENMMGGLIFTWQDEWFKRTWNTMDYDNPDRRPYWSNAQTNEQQFGLLSFDRHKIKVDGKNDWDASKTLLSKNEGSLQSLAVDHDERYLYIKTELETLSDTFWDNHHINLYFSIRPEKGIDVFGDASMRADFRLTIRGKDEAVLETAGDYDPFLFHYTEDLNMVKVPEKELERKEKIFRPIHLALNKGLVRPDTGEEIPFESYETGVFRFGNGNPNADDYDSLADYFFTKDGRIEIRIPWMLVNAKDPSQKEFMGDIYKNGIDASIKVDGVEVAAAITDDNSNVEKFPDGPALYTWDNWDLPQYEERLKDSYPIIQQLFKDVK